MSALPTSSFGVAHHGVAYLTARGCTPETATKLGIRFVTHAEANDLLRTDASKRSFYPKRDALWLPTRGPSGVLHPYHGQAIFFNPGKKPFKIHTETTEEYPNEVNYLLTKPLAEGDTLYWNESTLKAAVPFAFQLNAIGMNGVWGFSKGKGRLVNSVKELPPNLVHVLITDSLNDKNKKSMTGVLNARRRWRLALRQQLGQCTLRYIELPKPPAEFLAKQENPDKADWGLDDLYVFAGSDSVRNLLLNTVEFHDADELKIWLDEFNSKFVYVKSISKVYDRDANQFLSKQNFFDNYASSHTGETSIAPAWFRSADRPEVNSLAFVPGSPELINGNLNIWKGFAIDPSSNDIAVHKYWVATILDAFGEEGRHFIEFAAALVQFPEKRLSRHVFLGGKQGTGKNFVVEPLARIFGVDHCQSWTVANFINNFNTLHRACRLGILNEPGDPHLLERKVLVAVGETLKKNADQNERYLQLEPKGVDIAVVDRLQSNITISNYGPPFELQIGDRRCIALLAKQHMGVVADNTLGTKPLSYWEERWNWLNNENGANEVMSYLKNYDLSKVDLDGHAPMTAYKAALLKSSIDTTKTFIEQLNANPLTIFRNVLGADFDFTDPFVFDAQVVARLFELTIRPIENEMAFTTSVGKLSLSCWECSSTQVTMRTKGPGGPSSLGARVYAIENNRITEYKSGSITGEKCIGLLQELKLQLLRSPGIR